MQHRLLDRLLLTLVRSSWTVSQRLTVSVPAVVDGVAFKVPLLYGIGLQNLQVTPHDRPLARAVRAVFDHRQGGVVDVGCNIGHFMQLCVLADRERPYAGFDPSLACCFYMQRFIADNRLAAHAVFPIGLGAQPGAAELWGNGPFDVSASFSPASHLSGRFQQRTLLKIERGDDLVPQLHFDRIALIKIDVEGLESEVLQGLEQTIARQRPSVIFEVLRYAETGGGDAAEIERVNQTRRRHAAELSAFFLRHGYRLFKLRRDTELKAVGELDPGHATDPVEMDHVAVPSEQAEAFLRAHGALRPLTEQAA